MDDSDDYFDDDDFTLDEKSIALLDLEEQKFRVAQHGQPQQRLVPSTSASTGLRRPAQADAPLPPPKRQKVSHGVGPGAVVPRYAQSTTGDDYDEDLPDISIVDGA